MLQLKSALARGSPLFKSLSQVSSRSFGGLGNKRKPTRRDLDKYEVVIIGGNLGAIFSRHLDDDSHGKYSTMVVFDQPVNQSGPLRLIYEQQRCAKTDYLINAKLAINMYTASEVGTVDKFLPEENAVVLKGGRKIGYNQLVVATGLKEDVGLIPGLEEAWADVDHPVYLSKDHSSWRSFHHPYPRWHYNFKSGDAFFCIPPYPYPGEVGGLNFFVSNEVWKWHLSTGKLSPKHSFTVVNANDTFCKHHEETDKFIKEKIQKLGIKVDYGWSLKSVDKTKNEAVFENLKTGQKETRHYGQLYTMIPTRPHDNLVQAGLASKESNFLLDVNRTTLQHNKYKNVFGIGDVNNIPTTKTFYGGFHQIHVVRHNIQRNLKGQSLNAPYTGYSKSPIYLGQNSITFSVHYYDQKASFSNLIDKWGGPISNIRYYFWAKQQKKRIFNWYLKKSWGPPTFKLKRIFRKELPVGGSEGPQVSLAGGQGGSQPIYQAVKRAAQDIPTPVGSTVTTGVTKDAKTTAPPTDQAKGKVTPATATSDEGKKSQADHEKKAGEEIKKSAERAGVVTEGAIKKATEEVEKGKKEKTEEKKKPAADDKKKGH